MRTYTVACVRCGHPEDYPAYRCAACDAPLVLRLSAADCTVRDAPGIWRHAGMLPRTRHTVTLGEGGTPLLPLDGPVHVKLESLNPSLSFKDRAMALATSVALDLGRTGLVLASTGNAAVSAATYAAAAGLGCRIYCATGSNAGAKLATARAHGAEVHLVDGHYSDAYAAAVRAAGEGALNVTTTYRNPLLTEAYRPIAAELLADLGAAPDTVVVPVGAGPLLRGIWLGFRDLHAAGLVERIPRMVGVQAAACAPLARAWAAAALGAGVLGAVAPDGPVSDGPVFDGPVFDGPVFDGPVFDGPDRAAPAVSPRDSLAAAWAASLREPLPVGPTAAAAIADALRGYEDEGLLTLRAARDSGGAVVAVDEAAIAAAGHRLARRGLFVEPAAAAAVAALDTGAIDAGGRTVAVLTGHGAKEPPGTRV